MSDQPEIRLSDHEESELAGEAAPADAVPPASDSSAESVSSPEASAETPSSSEEAQESDQRTSGRRRRRRRKRQPAISLAELQPGMELTGIVRTIQPFGAFVDIGAETDGLVHISELRDGFVEKVEDVVQVGDVVTVRVKEVDVERGRVSLTMRSSETGEEPQSDRLPLEAIEEGKEYTGIVTSIVDFGAFVDIGAETDGLVHISELSDTRVNRVEDVVQVGQEVKVRVLSVDRARNRISLTMRSSSAPEVVEQPVEEEERREPHTTLFAVAFARAAEQQKQKKRKKRGAQEEEESPMLDIIRRTLEQLHASDS